MMNFEHQRVAKSLKREYQLIKQPYTCIYTIDKIIIYVLFKSNFSVSISVKENIQQFYFIKFFIFRSHYLFETCERKNTYKVEGMEENHFHTPVIFLSFAIYLLSQGPFKDELWSICFCLVPFSWFMNIYIKNNNNIRWNAGVIEKSLWHDGFVPFLHYFFLMII